MTILGTFLFPWLYLKRPFQFKVTLLCTFLTSFDILFSEKINVFSRLVVLNCKMILKFCMAKSILFCEFLPMILSQLFYSVTFTLIFITSLLFHAITLTYDHREVPWSSGKCQGLTVWAMVLGHGFNSRVNLKTRWIRWTTWWQKKNENNKDSQKGQVTPKKNIKKNTWSFSLASIVKAKNQFFIWIIYFFNTTTWTILPNIL